MDVVLNLKTITVLAILYEFFKTVSESKVYVYRDHFNQIVFYLQKVSLSEALFFYGFQ